MRGKSEPLRPHPAAAVLDAAAVLAAAARARLRHDRSARRADVRVGRVAARGHGLLLLALQHLDLEAAQIGSACMGTEGTFRKTCCGYQGVSVLSVVYIMCFSGIGGGYMSDGPSCVHFSTSTCVDTPALLRAVEYRLLCSRRDVLASSHLSAA